MNHETDTLLPFLSGGGEMGEHTRTKNWSNTSLGDARGWPQSLCITLGIMLHSKFPMFLWWGPDLICFYNDAYRPSLGENGKHPSILGKTAREAWPEIWDTIKPLIDKVLDGTESVWFEDLLVPIFRNGKIEDVYWTFSYSPVLDETGKKAGVLVTCTETTDKVNNLKLLKESEEQLQFAIEATELGTWDLNPVTNKFTGNDRLKEWFGLPPENNIDLSSALNVIASKDRERVTRAIQDSMQYASGGYYDIEYSIDNPLTGRDRIVRAKGRAWFNPDQVCFRFNGTLQDITAQAEAFSKIEESNIRYYRVLMQSPFAFSIMKGKEMIVTMANDLMKEFWGKGKNVEGKPILMVLPELADQPFPAMFDSVFTTGIPISANEILARIEHDGRIVDRYFNLVYQPYIEADESISGLITIAHEVTNQVLTRKKIEESEERFRSFADQAPLIIFMANEDGNVTYWNRNWLEFSGQSFEEALGISGWQKITHPDDYSFLLDTYLNATRYKKNYSIEIRMKRWDGEYRYLLFSGGPRYLPDGEFEGYVGTGIDTTDRKRAEDALKESEQRFRTMAETMPEIAWVASPDSPYSFFNKRFYEYTGMSREEAHRDWKWKSIVHPDMFEERNKTWEHCLVTGEDFYFESLLKRHSDQTYRWHISRATAIKNDKGEVILWAGTSSDIHEQKLFEAELEQQVKQRTKDLQDSVMHLQHSNENLEQFASIASHDLQEPLRKIQTFAALLQMKHEDTIPEEAKVLIDKIKNSSNRMSQLIRDVLNFSKITQTSASFVLADLDEILNNILNDFELLVEEKNVHINRENLPCIECIPVQINQLFYNLLNNAIKFSGKGYQPVINISSKKLLAEEVKVFPELIPSCPYFQITFSDNGIGFDKQFAEEIFLIFHRLNNSKEYSGTGIGLALCKKIVEYHHGKLYAEGKDMEGACFTIILPEQQSQFI